MVRRPQRPPRRRKPKPAAKVRPRLPAARQRQRLIDACISALHIHGPSETTVEKVVQIARLSPGIVRFYFKSKSAMLLASLRHLATEFEQMVVEPVGRLKARPIEALEKLVDLYLDPSISSPRKVSVWYAFWGEATARQEYLDICGEKDERFAALVRELIDRLVVQSGQSHLDADAIALGLIGALEIIWQGIAFQNEANVDRVRARERCLAYLASVFPGYFDRPGTRSEAASFDEAWQLVGRLAASADPGDYLSIGLHRDRAFAVRGRDTVLAFRNVCPISPHALVMPRRGHFNGHIDCTVHRLRFNWDGSATNSRSAWQLERLRHRDEQEFIFVRTAPDATGSAADLPRWPVAEGRELAAADEFRELDVAAHWQVMMEQLLLHRLADSVEGRAAADGSLHIAVDAARRRIVWRGHTSGFSGWSSQRLETLLTGRTAKWERRFIWPNLLFESGPTGLGALQIIPAGAVACRLQCFDFPYAPRDDIDRGIAFLASRLEKRAVTFEVDLAVSTQQGMGGARGRSRADAPVSTALRAFRQFCIE